MGGGGVVCHQNSTVLTHVMARKSQKSPKILTKKDVMVNETLVVVACFWHVRI